MEVSMIFDTIKFERRDRVAYVTLNRPDRLNAMSDALIADLRAAAAAIEADQELRAVLLTGAGRGFCAGADLSNEGYSAGNPGEIIRAQMHDHFNPMINAWYHLPIPVVVAVNGVAAGAGASLALVGDIVLAAKSATFLQLFAPKLGLIPDLGSTFHLPRMVGTARAKGLTMLGEPLSATDAADWGLIWRMVEDAQLLEQAADIAQRFANGPTQAFRRIKLMFNVEPPETLAEQMTRETEAQAVLAATADFTEGVAAFLNKRAPKFTGT
jgi:2-(1,2-epoxy-1,2-dihydrophenyl)acetyl-CoA isomerase